MTRRAVLLFGLLFSAVVAAPCRAESRQVDTRHYRIHTDLDQSLADDLGTRLDAMYEEYAQRLAIFKPDAAIAPRLQVYLFRTQREYERFTGGRVKNSGGMFFAGHNLLAAFLDGQGRDQLRRTLQHEAFHQFAYNAISPNLPVWLNEGLAQYFEEGLWNGQSFLLGEAPPRRIRQLEADVKNSRLVAFPKLLAMTPGQWTARLAASREDGATQYNQSWAMVHFLVMSRDARGQFLYRTRLLDMLSSLHEGKNAFDSFQLAFGGNVRGFQQRFLEYAKDLKATPEATLIENQCVLADLLVDFERKGRRFDSIGSLRRYVLRGHFRLHYSRGDLQWDSSSDMDRYFADLHGNLYNSDALYLAVHDGAPLPDIVCRCGGQLVLRTRFYDAAHNGIDHESLIESLAASASIR